MADLGDLRAAYTDQCTPSGGHLTDDDWERLACDELGEHERRAVGDHLATCRECGRIAAAVLAVRSEASAFDPGAPPAPATRPAGVGWRFRRLVVPGVLAAAAAVVLGVLLWPLPDRMPAIGGPTDDGPVLRGEHVPAPAPVAPVDVVSTDPVFAWRPVEDAAEYVVELLDREGELLWTSAPTPAAQLSWPAEVPLEPGRYYWRVAAFRPAGGPPLTSDLAAFDVGEGLTASPR